MQYSWISPNPSKEKKTFLPGSALNEQGGEAKRQFRSKWVRAFSKVCCITLLCSNLFRTANGLIARLVRSLWSREQKPKIFLPFFFSSAGGMGGADKKWKGNFWFLLRRFRLLKEQSYFNIFVCSFLRSCGETRRFLSAFGGDSKLCGFVHWQW